MLFFEGHVEAGTSEKMGELGVMTILRPNRAGQASDLGKVERLESGSALGLSLELGSAKHILGFRKANTQGKAELSDFEFDGPILVSKRN